MLQCQSSKKYVPLHDPSFTRSLPESYISNQTKPPRAEMPKLPKTLNEAEEEVFVPLNLDEEQDMSLDLSGWKL